MKLKGKVVLITGASTGIGQGTAVAFAKKGAKVVIGYNTNKKGANETFEKIRKLGKEAIVLQANVSKPREVQKLFKKIIGKFGRLDILINNAGYPHPGTLEKSSKEAWLRVFNDNLMTTVLCSKEAVKIMKQQKAGKIINTTSVLGLDYMGRQGVIGYSATKAAVINFTKTLAKEVAPTILVNAIAPGRTLTPLYESYDKKDVEEMIKANPIKRFVTVDEIAKTFLYVAENDAIIGEVIVVDGGFALK